MKPMKNRPYATDRSRWEAVLRREREADGVFLYGVLTTLVYCRPVCASRRPNYENVRFFDTWEQAEQASFRPCKRCCPRSNAKTDGPEEKIVMACRRMDEAEEHIPLKKLAAESGLSPYHFHRLFKKTTGVTPKQYAVRKRLNRVRSQLKKTFVGYGRRLRRGLCIRQPFLRKRSGQPGNEAFGLPKGRRRRPNPCCDGKVMAGLGPDRSYRFRGLRRRYRRQP